MCAVEEHLETMARRWWTGHLFVGLSMHPSALTPAEAAGLQQIMLEHEVVLCGS